MKFLRFCKCGLATVGFSFIFGAAIAGFVTKMDANVTDVAIVGGILLVLSGLTATVEWYYKKNQYYKKNHSSSKDLKFGNIIFPEDVE